MGLRQTLAEFFKCSACEARKEQIEDLREQIRHLRYQEEANRGSLLKAVRLAPVGGAETRSTHDPVSTGPQPWTHMRKKLEELKRRPKTPEDEKNDYWKKKAQEMETELASSSEHSSESSLEADYMAKDLEDLSDAS